MSGARLAQADIDAAIVGEAYQAYPGTTLTLCMLTLRNGAKVVGCDYGAIDPAAHDAERGKREARAAAVEKIWELEGYLLREQLYAAAWRARNPLAKPTAFPPFSYRVFSADEIASFDRELGESLAEANRRWVSTAPARLPEPQEVSAPAEARVVVSADGAITISAPNVTISAGEVRAVAGPVGGAA